MSVGQDLELVYKSWRRILDTGVETIYPGHGEPMPAARIREELEGL